MKHKKVTSTLCLMDEHDLCSPRWTENDASGMPTIPTKCVCSCHDPGAAERANKTRAAFLDGLKEQT